MRTKQLADLMWRSFLWVERMQLANLKCSHLWFCCRNWWWHWSGASSFPLHRTLFVELLWVHCLPYLWSIFAPHGCDRYNSSCLFPSALAAHSYSWDTVIRWTSLHPSAPWDVRTTRFPGNSQNGFVVWEKWPLWVLLSCSSQRQHHTSLVLLYSWDEIK